MTNELTGLKSIIFDLIRKNPGFTIPELRDLFSKQTSGYAASSTAATVDELYKLGYIYRAKQSMVFGGRYISPCYHYWALDDDSIADDRADHPVVVAKEKTKEEIMMEKFLEMIKLAK